MNKDNAVGAVIFLSSIAFLLIYIWLILFSPWSLLVVQITLIILVGVFLGIVAWIGYTIATTKPPKPLEEIEKELKEELKKLKT